MAWTKEQELAIQKKDTNIIVSAGAGSGKTAVLTARTMRILKENIHINELLILTFTKAAAGEMKERIRKNIKKESVDNPNLIKELELIDQAYITTFDSFALSIVKKYHYLLNISNNISITDSSIIDIKKIKIMDDTFTYFYEHPTDNFNKLIYDFCVKDDKQLQKDILKIASKIDGLPNRYEYLNNYINDYLNDEYITKSINEYEQNILNEVKEIKKLEDNLYYLVDGEFESKFRESIENIYNATSIEELQTILSNIKLARLPAKSDDSVKQAKESIKKALDNITDTIEKYGNKKEIKSNIDISKSYIIAIIDIIKLFIEKLHKYKEENEIYDFQDIALLSIKILKENVFVREELKNSFKEIMIDEYQDTNDIQETFVSMIDNNNVYMVGDIKQSIYRFRNANPYIFKSKYDNYAKNNGGIKIDLVKNFRSREEVLSDINKVFNLIMDNNIGGAEYHDTHQMVFGNTSYNEEGKTKENYNFEVLEYHYDTETIYTKEEIEIFTIANDIKNKINNKFKVFDKDNKEVRDITYKDFVILIDRTTDFDLYKKIFEYLGIPLSLLKDSVLNTSDDIYILKNIIDLIIRINKKDYNTEFKYDYISIARSYLYNLDDKEIFNTFKNNDFFNTKIYQDFYPISKKLYSLSISNILDEIIEITNIYEKTISVGNINDFIIRMDKLLDIASNLSLLGYNIYTFQEYLNELFEIEYEIKYSPPVDNSNSVKIMTIHKSKGLEYHVCYYSGLYKEFNESDIKDRFLLSNKYGIVTPIFKEGIKNTIFKYLTKVNYYDEEISEKIRLLYVALTRAKEKMILITPQVDGLNNSLEENNTIDLMVRKKYRSFSDILNSIKSRIIDAYKEINIEELHINKDYLYKLKKNKLDSSKIEDNLNIEELPSINKEIVDNRHFSKENLNIIDEKSYNNMKYGTKIHEVLEYIDFKNPNYDLIEDNFIKEKIQKFLTNPFFSNFNNVNIYNEYEFVYEENNESYHGIIDLLLEYEDRILIIDYKLSNIEDSNYNEQLKGYKKYIESISNKEVSIYLYSILQGNLEKL